MFINEKTGRPAWLLGQDTDATWSDGEREHTAPAAEFFGAHREATPAEIRANQGGRPAAPKAKPAAAPKAKPAAAPKAKAKARKSAAKASAPAKATEAPAAAQTPPATPPGAPKAQVRVEPLS